MGVKSLFGAAAKPIAAVANKKTAEEQARAAAAFGDAAEEPQIRTMSAPVLKSAAAAGAAIREARPAEPEPEIEAPAEGVAPKLSRRTANRGVFALKGAKDDAVGLTFTVSRSFRKRLSQFAAEHDRSNVSVLVEAFDLLEAKYAKKRKG